jgi:hypothetical protein
MDATPGTPGRAAALPRALLTVLLAVTVAGTLIATSRYGMGLTPDSVRYLHGADSLAHGHGYTAGGDAITDFPPGYSFLLSLLERVGFDGLDAARLLSVVCFVTTVALGYVLLRRHVQNHDVLIGGTVLIACSAVLLQIYDKALSEHAFLVVLLLFVLAAETLLDRPRDLRLLAVMAGLVWAAFYLRYAGVFLVVVGALLIVISEWSGGSSEHARSLVRAGVWSAVALAAPAVWMVRNVNAGSGPMGSRSAAADSYFANTAHSASEFSTWLATDGAPAPLRSLLFAALVIGVVVLLVLLAQGKVTPPAHVRSLLPLLVVVVAYVVYLVVSSSLVAIASINTRLMVPVYIPIVVIGAWFFEWVRSQLGSVPWRRAVNAAAIAWLVLNVGWFGVVAVRSARDGAGGYATRHWHGSAIMSDVRKLDFSLPTYSNAPDAIWLFTGHDIRPSVARTAFHSEEQTGKLQSFVEDVACAGHATLVWFQPNPRPYLYTPEQLGRQLVLTPVARRDDGIIYDVRARRPATAARCARG